MSWEYGPIHSLPAVCDLMDIHQASIDWGYLKGMAAKEGIEDALKSQAPEAFF